MNYCQELVDRYFTFYEPERKRGKGYTSTGCVKPFDVALYVLTRNTRTSDEELEAMIAAEVAKLMSQIHAGTAEGRWKLHGEEEVQAIQEFSRFFMQKFWKEAINCDRSRISGNRDKIYRNTCEFLVRRKKD